MSAINLNYNKEKIKSDIIDNTIVLIEKDTNKVVYKFPLPKGFSILGIINHFQVEDRLTYVITPYKIEPPKYIPEGYGDLRLETYGLWSASNGKNRITYIDTSFLTPKDYEYPTIGKFQIKDDEIPPSFWMPDAGEHYVGWSKPQDIYKVVKDFYPKARLINEEELLSIYALSDYGFEFWEHIPDDIYDTNFMKNPSKYILCANEFFLDNWDIVAASRENRNILREIIRVKARCCEQLWYRNTTLQERMDKKTAIYIFPVLECPQLKEEQDVVPKRKLI